MYLCWGVWHTHVFEVSLSAWRCLFFFGLVSPSICPRLDYGAQRCWHSTVDSFQRFLLLCYCCCIDLFSARRNAIVSCPWLAVGYLSYTRLYASYAAYSSCYPQQIGCYVYVYIYILYICFYLFIFCFLTNFFWCTNKNWACVLVCVYVAAPHWLLACWYFSICCCNSLFVVIAKDMLYVRVFKCHAFFNINWLRPNAYIHGWVCACIRNQL